VGNHVKVGGVGMRYIGSKLNLLPQLDAAISERKPLGGTFCDVFSGTGAVGRYFKNRFPVISNDLLYFSHVLQYASIQLNQEPDFTKLEKEIGEPFHYLNSLDGSNFKFNSDPFVSLNFSPYQNGERMYFTEKNALAIDAIRQTLNYWLESELISKDGYMYLLASLLEFVPSVSNIAGTYGAYLKHWDSRASKPIFLEPVTLTDNSKQNISYNENANELVRKISGEVLYIDPPYNGRQYLGNYHVLESIAKYDSPVLKGKTGTREDLSKVSDYCKKGKVAQSFDDLLANANFDYVFISYSTEGLLTEDELVSIAERHSDPKKLKVYKFPYRRYSRIKDENKPTVHEIVVSAAK
jgi:adenine-specific DNA-methyltransferase